MEDREALVEQIYEAAAVPDRWPTVLEQLGRRVNTPGVVLLTRRSDSWIGHKISKPLEVSMLDYLATDIPTRTETTARLLAADHAGFLSDEDLYAPNEWEVEPFYSEWCRKWGWNHAAATAIQIPSGDALVIHVQAATGAPSFSRTELAELDSFRPHLARAGMLAARWRMERLRAAAQALAVIGLPAAVLDRDGRVLAANDLIEAMNEYVSWLPKNRIALADRGANELLRQAVAGLYLSSTTPVQSFPARSMRADEGTVIVHLIPSHGEARDIFDGGLALLALTPVHGPEAPDAALIRGLFDLSPSEARVAREITRGRTVDQIASFSGVERDTIRSQIKSIFAKTGTHRQAEVAALLASLPTFPIKK